MSYHALYRAYRPQFFRDVVGQVHIVRTMQNALKSQRTAHAYLFSGPRGTGKTSIAKVVAKAINCQEYPTAEPCGECANCKSIKAGSNPDVLEIDAASNNGVDEIREIRDKVKYAPSTGRFKVYIIDEVHMLSTGAFNALLKTLEEPPAHVIFILATTEPHKIPATIISRCQRFDFKQISTKEIEAHVASILKEQEVAYEPEAATLIATLAEGGMRDALSLLDQVISYAGEKVLLEDVHALSGTVDHGQVLEIIKGLHEEEYGPVMDNLQNLFVNGKEPARIIEGLTATYRDILAFQKIGRLASEILSGLPLFGELSENLSSPVVVDNLFKLGRLQQELRFANHPELMLEVGLLGLRDSQAEGAPATDVSPQLEKLQKEIQKLQKDLKRLEEKSATVPQLVQEQSPQIKMDLFKLPNSEENIILPEAVPADSLTIEAILGTATAAMKGEILAKWEQLNPYQYGEESNIATLLKDGTVAAASPLGFILVYKHEPSCKRLLREDNGAVAQKIVHNLFGNPMPYLVLPEAFWVEVRTSYLEQKQQGIEPKLKQYSQSLKNVIDYKEEGTEPQRDFVDDIIETYGAELVEVHN
ncbi:MAG: DNA polymerase III subunit gamma/tau [Turicibacter sp.]|nr:DNA polymerase III subunit gamma/tau [Turicibacter sp.]